MPEPARQCDRTPSWLIEAWLESLKSAYIGLAGGGLEAAWESVTEQPAAGEYATAVSWWEQPVVSDLPESFGIGVPDVVALALAGGEEDAANFVEGLLNRTAAALAATLPEAGAVTHRGHPPVGGTIFAVRLERVGEPAGRLWAVVSPELAERLREASEPAVAPAAEPSAEAPAAPPHVKTRLRTMDVLLEVELPIRISLGRSRLALKDVLKLTTGSVLELNRALVDPVDVVVNNCIVARGELVVVEGNYGIRIQEINDRNRRAASGPGCAN